MDFTLPEVKGSLLSSSLCVRVPLGPTSQSAMKLIISVVTSSTTTWTSLISLISSFPFVSLAFSMTSKFLLCDCCEELHHTGFWFFGRFDDLHEVVVSVRSDVFDDRLLLRSWEFHRVDYDCGFGV